ncbi:hypothetical protein HPP92_011288 [Vanilla planifolia]|uniref:CCHC-type domain-containing protein n=1 Tax=Vanilla planifolia TaxID=51239 RepID=A0A835V0W0_VANPL|nr:hypothetical protein HPP92_011288 [Vanilla planifolia]
MGTDDFIKLSSPGNSDHQGEEICYLESQAKKIRSSICKEPNGDVEAQDFIDANGTMVHVANDEEDNKHVLDMDLEEETFMPKQPIVLENIQLIESSNKLEKVKFESKHDTIDISTHHCGNTTMKKPGVKRARTTCNDEQPSVRIIYSFLTRESKKKLMELMQQWSQWQANYQSSNIVSQRESLEFGEDTYFAALHVGLEKNNTVSFWLDNRSRKEEKCDSANLDSDIVPLYDRGFSLSSTSLDGLSNLESGVQNLEDSRCFNCGSYSHALKECTKPRDNVAISNARKQHNSKRSQTTGSHSQTRYYQKSSGKFNDLKAGVLGPETRECLGIGEFDPPPWLNRMRELGYPPGYLGDIDEDQPSGITIFADEEPAMEFEEGELPEKAEPAPPEKRMMVDFPGINAPIPEKADDWLWASPSTSSRHNSHSISNRSPDIRDDRPPGSAHGLAAFSRPPYSPRYGSQDYASTPRSPYLGRSLSDRSWPSPSPYEGSPSYGSHSPYPYSGMAWQSPRYSPAAHSEHWNRESPYGMSSDGRDVERYRQDHHVRRCRR